MTTIETARKLLADASPELRVIVSMCIADANFTGFRIAHTVGTSTTTGMTVRIEYGEANAAIHGVFVIAA